MKLIFSLLQVDSVIFDEVDQACPKYPGKFAISLWRLKEVRNEVRDLTALAGSNTTLTVYHTPLNLFLSQKKIYTKLFSSFG